MGGALQVSYILFEISCTSCSSVAQVVCHWLLFSWSFSNVLVSSFIWGVFCS